MHAQVMHTSLISQMARELDEILRGQIAEPANSCKSDSEVSFLDQVISPLYDVIAKVSFLSNLFSPMCSHSLLQG